jgi:hypothetical protein
MNQALINIFWTAAPLLVTLLSFFVYVVVQENTLSIPVAFTA